MRKEKEKFKWIDREKESIDRLVSIVDKSLRGTFGMAKKEPWMILNTYQVSILKMKK